MIIMRTLITFGLCFLLASCAISIGLPQETIDQIPAGANRVDLYSDLSVNDLNTQFKEFLAANEYTVTEENEATRRVETSYKDIGQRTSLRIVYRTNPVPDGSRLEVLGVWSSDVEEFDVDTVSQNVSSEDTDSFQVTWTGKGRGSYAYAQIVNLVDEFPPGTDIKYVKQ